MPKYRVHYYYEQGVDHHHPDYMTPDAGMERNNRTVEIKASNEEEAKEIIRKRHFSPCTIEKIEKI